MAAASKSEKQVLLKWKDPCPFYCMWCLDLRSPSHQANEGLYGWSDAFVIEATKIGMYRVRI